MVKTCICKLSLHLFALAASAASYSPDGEEDRISLLQLQTQLKTHRSPDPEHNKANLEQNGGIEQDPMFDLAKDFLKAVGGEGDDPSFENLRSSVVRIQVVSSKFNWQRPYEEASRLQALGSGFVVQRTPYPLFVTNAHVVKDAHQITLQMLAYGEQQWPATVVSICKTFDIALLVLKDAEAFTQALDKKNLSVKPLTLSTEVPQMGADVVAVGFPLGQSSLKIAKGNVAGNEVIDEYICLQSTAPISPGNSGGPLLNAKDSSVLGINFASATEGENINFVVPSWRVQKVIDLHLHEHSEKNGKASWDRRQVRVPSSDLVAVEANKALYSMSGGCDHGVFISEIGKWSFFTTADPPMPGMAFLVSVNGIKLDKFGMGHNPKYASDLVYFTDLVWMRDSSDSPFHDFHFVTCRGGKSTEHKASLAWHPEFDRGIRSVEEPTFDNVEYEIFGDLTIMEMTDNHIQHFAIQMGLSETMHWLHPNLMYTPRLIVSDVKPGSYADDFLVVGSAVERVNGKLVSTLKEYREQFIPGIVDGASKLSMMSASPGQVSNPEASSNATWTLQTDMGQLYAVNFLGTLQDQIKHAEYQSSKVFLTSAVVDAAKILNISTSVDLGRAQRSQDKIEMVDIEGADDLAAGPSLVSKKLNEYTTEASLRLRSRNGRLSWPKRK